MLSAIPLVLTIYYYFRYFYYYYLKLNTSTRNNRYIITITSLPYTYYISTITINNHYLTLGGLLSSDLLLFLLLCLLIT